jgi:putative transposase
MARRHRELVENGFYHVFNRGISRKHIQFSRHFQELFFNQIALSLKKYSVEIHAYCLMTNHYHLLIKTPDANLDRFMQHFGSGLSRKINMILGGDGALFKSRYRSVRVDSEVYLLQLMKYIHLNPVEAGFVDKPEEYRLSSFPAYIDYDTPKKWLKTDFLCSLFNGIDSLHQFHEAASPREIKEFYSKVQIPDFLG